MPKLTKNSIHTVTIDGYSSTGQGVARLDGMAVFVKGALRGERCRISLMKAGKSCAWARVLKVLDPSPARVTPDCPHYPKCGGCGLRHMSYVEELEMKRQRVEDALRRLGGLDLTVDTILAAEHPERYRNKTIFPVSQGHAADVKVGFYRERSHDVIDVPCCLIQSDLADKTGRVIRKWMHKYAVPAYDEMSGDGLVRHLFVRTNRWREALICIVAKETALPRERELVQALRTAIPKLAGIVLNTNTRKTNVILGSSYRTLWGRDHLEDELCGLRFRLSVPSFFQVHRAQAEVLYQKAVEFAGLTEKETVLDLYCGTGTISLVMARQAAQVIGAEIVPEAVEDAKKNARRNGFQNAEFLCADASEAAAELLHRGVRPDVVSVDPPRKGLSSEVIDTICAMRPKRVVYISCNPATLARDLKQFAELEYDARCVVAVDLFSRTHHVETVALITRQKVADKQ